ncbi:MAG TPA: hypothetical protein VMY18_11745, partial [Acidobacteriota bacterium]|nr:hypothetical protein [Acidobacteriota bacterium]
MYPGAQSTTESAGTQFETPADVTVSVEEAEAKLFMNRAKIVTLNIASSPASIKRLKKSYS